MGRKIHRAIVVAPDKYGVPELESVPGKVVMRVGDKLKWHMFNSWTHPVTITIGWFQYGEGVEGDPFSDREYEEEVVPDEKDDETVKARSRDRRVEKTEYKYKVEFEYTDQKDGKRNKKDDECLLDIFEG